MERVQVESTNLASVGYDHDSATLEIKFHSGGIYQYSGVPQDIYKSLMKAGSKGDYFNNYVKERYRYKRIR